jgi:cytochrome c1
MALVRRLTAAPTAFRRVAVHDSRVTRLLGARLTVTPRHSHIPGIQSTGGMVAPLPSNGSRVYLAGRLPNTSDNISTWIQHPRAVDEKTAMPETGVTDADARDITAYGYTLR